MKVLQICHKIPYPPHDGGSIAIYNTSIGLLENEIEVNVLAINPSRDHINIDIIPEAYKAQTKFTSVDVDTGIRPGKAFLNIFSQKSYFAERFDSTEFQKAIIEKITSETYDVIQLEHLYMCVYIEPIRKYSDAKIVLRTQNVEFEIWKGYLKNMSNPLKKIFVQVAAKRLKNFEISSLSKVDGIIAITSKDADTFKQYISDVPVIDVPVSFRDSLLTKVDGEKQYEKFPAVYHLGSMDWRPNVEAINWFIKDIFPLVVKKLPDIRIYLAGKKMPQFLFQKSNGNLIVEGKVEDAVKYQEDKAIMFVPLLSGSGIRAKIIEGMSMGKTVISTSVGAQGIACTNNENILIADTPEEFAIQFEKCVNSEQRCRKIGNNAKKFAIEKFHASSCARMMIDFYNILL